MALTIPDGAALNLPALQYCQLPFEEENHITVQAGIVRRSRYAGPWFTVDTAFPVWKLNDNRNPPLWHELANTLSFRFEGPSSG